MGITLLEEKYQRIKEGYAPLTAYFTACAEQASLIQSEMREIFNQITPRLCSACENKCCEGFPLAGWFSLEDYILFRVKYGKPVVPHNRINHPTACSFVTPRGCSLPEDLRPFTCVKINCSNVTEAIKERGEEDHFNHLISVLDAIRIEVSSTIKEHTIPLTSHRLSGEQSPHLFDINS